MADHGLVLTPSQREAVEHPDHIYVDACPGSGKTRALISKLARCAEEVRDTARKVACITYTNAGVHEIEQRLRQVLSYEDSENCDVSTIHAFALRRMLGPFSWLLDNFPSDFSIVTSDDPLFQDAAKAANKATEASYAMDDYGYLDRGCDGASTKVVPDATAQIFWHELLKRNALDFCSVLYCAQLVVSRFPWVARALGARYAWFLLDETQDTTEVQFSILKALAAWKTSRFFLVGDVQQAIYGFAGARPEHVGEFADVLGARRDVALKDNFRSSPAIIRTAEEIIPRGMVPGSSKQEEWSKPVYYCHRDTASRAIIEEFIPRAESLEIEIGECAVLAPAWFKLLPLGRALREFGISITGPGARPYKRQHVFAQLAEQLCAAINGKGTSLYRLEQQVFFAAMDLCGSPQYNVYSYDGRRAIYHLLHDAVSIRDDVKGNGVEWLVRTARSCEDSFLAKSWMPTERTGAMIASVRDMLVDMRGRVDLSNLSTEDLGLFANTGHSMKLLTMHRAKGREFKAVALIDLHEGRIPDYRATTPEAIQEATRLFYVAASRAKQLLMLVTDEEHERNAMSIFLKNLKDTGIRQIPDRSA